MDAFENLDFGCPDKLGLMRLQPRVANATREMGAACTFAVREAIRQEVHLQKFLRRADL